MDIARRGSQTKSDKEDKSRAESSVGKKNIDILEVDTSESRSAVGTQSK